MLRKQKGITLIALVVTIIILLILAGVSISMVAGDDGVIKRATNAKEETTIAQEGENVFLAATSAKMQTETGEILEDNLDAKLANVFGKDYQYYEIEDIGEDFLISSELTGETYRVSKDGTMKKMGEWQTSIDASTNAQIITDGVNTIQIGDYIDYDCYTDAKRLSYTSTETRNGTEDQTFTLNENTLWRVVGVSKAGEILITTENAIAVDDGGEFVYTLGFDNETTVVEELDNISKIFGQGYGAVGARSIRIEDVNNVTGYDPEKVAYREGQEEEYGVEVSLYWNEEYYSWGYYPYYTTTNGLSGTSLPATNTGFCYYDNGLKKSPKPSSIEGMEEITTIKNSLYTYYAETLEETGETEKIGLLMDTKAYDCIFPDREYLCASPCESFDGGTYDYCMFEVVSTCADGGRILTDMIFHHQNEGGATENYIRPVVTLDSDIKLTGNSDYGWTIVK